MRCLPRSVSSFKQASTASNVVSLPLSVVVPVRNGASTIGPALTAIRASQLSAEDYELIVVDDGSSDRSATIAARHADIVIRLSGRRAGPAYARNRGAEMARGEVIAFVDQDVVVRPETLTGMIAALANQPGLDAVSASHDDTPGESNFVSQYWTLLLHFGEQRYAGVSAHFNSACGAVRRSALMSAGMYDEWRFETGCLESLELGQRLHDRGRGLLLSHELQVTHLKRWSFASVCQEVWQRSALLSRSLGYRRTWATVPSEVVFTLSRAAVPALAVVGILVLTASFLPNRSLSAEWAVAVAAVLLSNATVGRYYARARGLGFAVAAAPLHIVVQGVAGVALCTGWLLRDAIGDRLPEATIQAYSEVGLEMWPPVPRRP